MDNKSIRLKNKTEYDFIKHCDKIIELDPGGHVGDADWKFQYLHNINVIMDRQTKATMEIANTLFKI